MEVVSPAGCPESVVAAVQNGADAVYMGLKDYNLQKNAVNFTLPELGRAIEYCRVRGVKTYLTLNMLSTNEELPIIAERAKTACRYGIDAIIIQDLGVFSAVRQAAPHVPVFAGAQMGIHNLEGVKMAAAMGFRRVTLSRMLSRKRLSQICQKAPIEVEAIVHGNLCIGYSGQCYLSTITDKKSENRGVCARPCERSFVSGNNTPGYPLSLKDYCLAHYLAELKNIGLTAVKIEGRARRPEYSAIVTAIYSKAITSGRQPRTDELAVLPKAFSPQGFTDGYYTSRINADMLGAPTEENKGDSVIFATARKNYLNGEFQRVPVRFVGEIKEGRRAKIGAIDDRGNTSVVYGALPQLAFHKQLTLASLQTQLHITRGTPFKCVGVKGKVAPGLALKLSDFDQMRRDLLEDLLKQRKHFESRVEGEFIPAQYDSGYSEPPVLTISVSKLSQLSKDILEIKPKILYIPVTEFDFESELLKDFLDDEDITVSAIIPRILHDNERAKISEALTAAAKNGVTEALVGNLGHILFARGHGLEVRGDFGFNVYNTESLVVLRNLRLKSAALSFEMKLSEIRQMPKPLDTELIVYGRLPLMITESCIIKNCTGVCACDNFSGLRDEEGALYPVLPELGCRNVVYSPNKLFMADQRRATSNLGLWAERLMFTTENAVECAAVAKRYAGDGTFEPLGHFRGVYFTGVE